MDFAPFDRRGYPVVSVTKGYGEWAAQYDDTVAASLDRTLLPALRRVEWSRVRQAADLACGTGRTGAWLAERGIPAIDGIDATPQMLELAAHRGVYRSLQQADVARTGLADSAYDLCTMALAD